MTLTLDTREPDPHPWTPYLPEGARIVRGTLETGDLTLAALPEGAVVERKTVPDFLAAIGRERERFDREVRRARHLGAFCIIVEGSFADVLQANRQRGQLSEAAIVGTVAAWTRRGAPVLFAGTVATAADLAFRFLTGQVREVQRDTRALARADRQEKPAPAPPCPPPRPQGSTFPPDPLPADGDPAPARGCRPPP